MRPVSLRRPLERASGPAPGEHGPLTTLPATSAYLSLDALAKHVGIGKRTLEKYLSDPHHPLPCYRLPGGRKRLVKVAEFDRWITAYREVGPAPDLRQTVGEILSSLRDSA